MDMKVLIVEDNPITAMDLNEIVDSNGMKVVGIAGSVEDALKIYDRNDVDVILIDIQLKGNLDGIDLATIIAKKGNVPFIFLTSNSMSNYIDRAKKTHPFGYLTKPIYANEICELASAALESD